MSNADPVSNSDTDERSVDNAKVEQLRDQIIADAGGALAVPLAFLGDKLGLFAALRSGGVATSAQLAERAGLDERYVREWLLVMAASGYITYVGTTGDGSASSARYQMSPEQVEIFLNTDSPSYMAGAFQTFSSAPRMLDQLVEAFRTGAGIAWHEHDDDTFVGTERFFRGAYQANLVDSWIPALDGVEQQLVSGVRAADVGCGLGASTIIMAKAYPATEWVGVDYHEPSLELARSRAAEAGVGNRITFQVASASELSGKYHFITFFDCLHDMPDPVAALSAARAALSPDGRVMLVEPMSSDAVVDQLTPLGRLMAGASVFVCLPSGLSAPPAVGLGNQAGPSRTAEIADEAGFSRTRVATSNPFNLVYELRP
jgi:2-polyprenyl-3-methyl-5-hydroxy-6-metoxy-1,4-benzoquinol methylase